MERAYLPYGVIGIKVWIYLGETFSDQPGTGGRTNAQERAGAVREMAPGGNRK
jgi:ribosomal protein S3